MIGQARVVRGASRLLWSPPSNPSEILLPTACPAVHSNLPCRLPLPAKSDQLPWASLPTSWTRQGVRLPIDAVDLVCHCHASEVRGGDQARCRRLNLFAAGQNSQCVTIRLFEADGFGDSSLDANVEAANSTRIFDRHEREQVREARAVLAVVADLDAAAFARAHRNLRAKVAPVSALVRAQEKRAGERERVQARPGKPVLCVRACVCVRTRILGVRARARS
eukprot:6207512-Pleurochrysis_carterae.AAC.1